MIEADCVCAMREMDEVSVDAVVELPYRYSSGRRNATKHPKLGETMSEPRKVKLPVCPVCNAVGKRPGDHVTASMRFSCDGGARHPHMRTKTEFRTFVEVES
jgi:hypothetical protein